MIPLLRQCSLLNFHLIVATDTTAGHTFDFDIVCSDALHSVMSLFFNDDSETSRRLRAHYAYDDNYSEALHSTVGCIVTVPLKRCDDWGPQYTYDDTYSEAMGNYGLRFQYGKLRHWELWAFSRPRHERQSRPIFHEDNCGLTKLWV